MVIRQLLAVIQQLCLGNETTNENHLSPKIIKNDTQLKKNNQFEFL